MIADLLRDNTIWFTPHPCQDKVSIFAIFSIIYIIILHVVLFTQIIGYPLHRMPINDFCCLLFL